MLPFYTPRKYQKTSGFLTFSESLKIECWRKMVLQSKRSKNVSALKCLERFKGIDLYLVVSAAPSFDDGELIRKCK